MTDLAYERVGSGPPVLVMHGGLGLDRTYLRDALRPLGDRFELVLYDHRGNGASPPLGRAPHGLPGWARDAEELRESLGLGRCIVFAHSYGSFVALHHVLAYPRSVRALILSNATPAFDYPERIQQNAAARATPEQLAVLSTMFATPPATDEDFARAWQTLLPLYLHRWDERHREPFVGTRYRAAGYTAGNAELATYDVRARLGEVNVPTLLLAAEDDWITPADLGAARLAAGISGSVVERFAQSGHFPFFEEPDPVLRALRGFLAGVG